MSSMISQWLNRLRLAGSGQGTAFNGKRDYYSVFGYNSSPTFLNFLHKYLRQDIAGRVINMPVNACWTDPPELMVSIEGEIWSDWQVLCNKLPIWATLRKADIFAGIGAFAIVVVGFDDGATLEMPVKGTRRNSIKYLQPYLEGNVEIIEYDTNQSSARFGLPVMYQVDPGDLLEASSTNKLKSTPRQKFKVHYSRVLHLADNTLESIVIGHSRLEAVYNVLDDILKVGGGSAETYWLSANRGMQVNLDKDVEMSDADEEALAAEIEEYQHQLRRIMRTRGVKIEPLGGDAVDPRGAFNVSIALLSANTGIPQRVLLGAEAGQLASQQDRANWSVQISARVTNWAEPNVLKPFIELLRAANVLDIPETLYIKWPETFKMSPLERAQTSAQMARSAVNVVRTLEVGQKIKGNIVSIEEAREIIAPGDKLPILRGLPKGTVVPAIEKVDPAKFELLPSQKAAAKAAKDGLDPNAPTLPGGVKSDPKPKDPDVSRPPETRGTNA